MKKISILVIEDNKLLRDGITAILKKQHDMHVVVDNGENVLLIMGKVKPDVVLLDLGLHNHNSLEIVKLSKLHFKETKIVVMDLLPMEADVLEFVQTGVSGFILKDASTDELVKTIRSVYQGLEVLPSHLTGSLFSQIVEHAINGSKASVIVESTRLTKREKQVIELIADGGANKEIAQKLNLSTYTIKSHVHNIMEKLALHKRVQVALHVHLSDSYKNAGNTTSLMSE